MLSAIIQYSNFTRSLSGCVSVEWARLIGVTIFAGLSIENHVRRKVDEFTTDMETKLR